MYVTRGNDAPAGAEEESSAGGGEISWRIPVEDHSPSLRFSLLPILFFGLIFALLFFLLAPSQVRWLGLTVMLPLVGVVLYLYWKSLRRGSETTDNVRIDESGVHWLDDFRREHSFEREDIRGFRIGLDADTLHSRPALTLLLAEGFQSQPIELYAPASPATVRRLLAERLRVPQRTLEGEEFVNSLRRSLDAALSAWPPAPEKRLLRRSLVEFVQQNDGSWLVCDLRGVGRVFYHGLDCSFRLSCGDGRNIEFTCLGDMIGWVGGQFGEVDAKLAEAIAARIAWKSAEAVGRAEIPRRAELAEFLARQIGPDVGGSPLEIDLRLERIGPSAVEVEGTLGEGERQWNVHGEIGQLRGECQLEGFVEVTPRRDWEQQRRRIAADARELGFFCRCDDDRCQWLLAGSQAALLNFCGEIDRAADGLKRAPLGARPQMRRLGGDAMHVTIQPAQHAWISGTTLCGPPQRLHRLAREIRQPLEEAKIGDKAAIQVSLDDREKWVFLLHVTDKEFDPTDYFQ